MKQLMPPTKAWQAQHAFIRVCAILAVLITGLPANAVWQVLLDGVDVSAAAAPLERGERILINVTVLAPVLHLQLTVRGDLITIRDPHGNDWQARDGGVTLQNAGRTMALLYPLFLQDGNIYLPIEAVNNLVDHHLALNKAGETVLTSINIGDKKIGDGWEAIDIPKSPSPPEQRPRSDTRNGWNGNATQCNLPPASDLLRVDVDTGYVQGADMGMEVNALGACYGHEVQLSGLVTRGTQGTRISNGYVNIVDTASGNGIELGNLSSDLLGGMGGARYSWRRGASHWPALSVYWDQLNSHLRHPVVSYSDSLSFNHLPSLSGEVSSQGEIALHSRFHPGRLGLYLDYRHTSDPTQSGENIFSTYALQHGITVSGGISQYGSGTSRRDWRNLALRVPMHHGYDFSLEYSKSHGQGTVSTTNTAMLTLPVGPLRIMTRYTVGEVENTELVTPSHDTYQDLMASTGYNVRPNLRFDIQAMSRWQRDRPVDQSSQFIGAYRLSSRSDLLFVSALPQMGSSDQFHLRWNYTISNAAALSLDFGQLTPYQNSNRASERGLMLMLHTRWGVATPTRGAQVAGMVRDEIGQPVSDCLVRLGDYRTTTEMSGRYHFDHVPTGAYVISLDNSSLPANFQGVTSSYSFTMRNGDRIHRDFCVIPLYAIIGKVLLTDSDGNNIASGVQGVVVHLGDAVTMTAANGTFGFYNLAPGVYSVQLDTERLSSPLVPVGASAMPVTLESTGETNELIFKVMRHDKDIIFQMIHPSGEKERL